MTEYTIRHRVFGDVGGFESMTAATLTAIGFGFAFDDWTIELVEARS